MKSRQTANSGFEKNGTLILNIIKSVGRLWLKGAKRQALIQTVKVCQVCLSAVYSEKTSTVVTGGLCAIKGDCVLLEGHILGLYLTSKVSSGALCFSVYVSAWIQACNFSEIHSGEANHSSVHICAMNKTLPALKESTAQRARDLNRGTRQGSAVCLIWTTLICLCSILLQQTRGGGREKSLSH